MKTATLASLAAAAALAGAPAGAQLPGVGLPSLGGSIGAPITAPAPAPLRPATPRIPTVRAPAAVAPSGSVGAAVARPTLPPAAMAVPGLAPIPAAMSHRSDGLSVATEAIGKSLSVTVPAGSKDIVLSTAGAATTAAAGVVDADPPSYAEQARNLLASHPEAIEPDAQGRPALRGEIAGVAMSGGALARARAAGFKVRARDEIRGLGLSTVVLAPPRGMSAADGLARLRALDPGGQYDLNHIYFESGTMGGPGSSAGAAARESARGLSIGLIDGAVAAQAPTLAAVPIVQHAFAPGGSRVTAHATAVASLIAGSGEGFHGAAPGARLFVADVYGPTPSGGSATAVARALGWLAEAKTPVINVSLVGPPNALLAAAIAAVQSRGHVVVAAVGNDGPAAPPLYPAAYPGVVAVTGVDARRRVLPEAGRGPYVAFAAPGADMAAAGLGGSLITVRGTSFAAPLAAGRLARLLPRPDRGGAARAVEALAREAADLGAPGRDPIYGRGLVAFDLAVRPTSLAARP